MKSNIKRRITILIAAFVGMVEVANAFYDPGVQRWINRDPIAERGGINLYSLSYNRPNNHIDPDGHDSCKIAGPFLVVSPSWWKFWRPSEEIYWGTPELYEGVVGKAQLANAIEAAAATAAGIAALGALDGHGKSPLPERDETGKVHGDLPSHVPKDWTAEQLQEVADELRQSIDRRKQEQEQLGEDGPHRKRIADEEDLLRQVERQMCK